MVKASSCIKIHPLQSEHNKDAIDPNKKIYSKKNSRRVTQN